MNEVEDVRSIEHRGPLLISSTGLMFYAHKQMIAKYKAMCREAEQLEQNKKELERWKRRLTPNNKLKMRGEPMRRKGA